MANKETVPHSQLDILIAELGVAEKSLANAEETRDGIRKEIFGIIENEGLTEGYKNDRATISYVQRKKVVIDEQNLMEEVMKGNIVQYFQVVPEHTVFTPKLTKDIKDGVYKTANAVIEVDTNLAVKFNK